jgi:hypothetical protein
VAKIDRHSGRVIWRLGGRRSDFAMGKGTQFSWQHDVRHLADGRMSVFDNGSDGFTTSEPQSRAIVLQVDHASRRVTLARAFEHARPVLAFAMGNVQMLPGGHVFVGWGTTQRMSELTAAGELVSEISVSRERESYRGFRLPWTGRPTEPPAITMVSDARSGRRTLCLSWNGATEVAYWQVLVGLAPLLMRPIGTFKRSGFETKARVPIPTGYAAAVALDSAGRQLGTSPTISF